MATGAHGEFTAAWTSVGQDGNTSGVYAQQFAVDPISIEALNASTQARQGETVVFSAVVINTDSSPVTYAWDFGDGTTMSGTNLDSPTHSYATTGLKLARLTVTDHYGNQSSAVESVLVRTSQSLIVNAGADASAFVGSPVTFSGTMSFPGGSISSSEIAWDMNYSGTSFTPTVTGTLTPTYTFTSPGVYTVALRVQDAETGAYALSTLTVRADYRGPTVTVGSDQTVTVGQSFTASGSYSDPDGTVSASGIEWDFDWSGEFVPDVVGTLYPTWHYDSAGTYTAMLRVTDSHGVADMTPITVTANYAAPYVNLSGPDLVAQGDAAGFDVGYSFANGAAPVGIEWDFHYNGTTFTPEPGSSGKATATTQYASPGTYTAAVRVTDANSVIYLRTHTVTVDGPRPTVTAPGLLTTTQGQSLTFSATVSSPNPVTIGWDFDYDGINFEPDPSVAGQLSPSHTYLAAGRHYAAIRASNGSDTRTTTRTIYVDVADIAPTANVSYSGPTPEGSPVNFTISNFADVNPNADFDFLVDWTGTSENFERIPDGEYTKNPYDGSVTFSRVFADDSGYSSNPVIVRVLDNEGDYRDYPLGVVVTNVAPTASLAVGGFVTGPTIIGEGAPIYFTVSDPSHRDWMAGFTYYYSVDGGSYTGTTGSKVYLPSYAPGYHQVSVYAVDKNGGAGPVQSATINVVDSNGRVANDSFAGGGSIQVSWTGGSAFLAPGQYYDLPESASGVRVTLLSSNANYRIDTNMGIDTVDYAPGVTAVNLNLGTLPAGDVYWFGDGNIGQINLPPGTGAASQSVLTVQARGDIGGIAVSGSGFRTWAYADSITARDVTGTISGFDQINGLFAFGWVNNISTHQGIGSLTVSGIRGTVSTTSDDLAPTTGLTASIGPGGILGELRIGRLSSFTAGGDINKLTVGQLDGTIQFTVAGDINSLYLGDATANGRIVGKNGQIKEAVYDQKAAEKPPQIEYMPIGLALVIGFPGETYADRFWATVTGGNPATGSERPWQVHHTKQQALRANYIAAGVDVDDVRYLRGVHPAVHSEITDAQNKWRDHMMQQMNLKPGQNQQFWKTVNMKEVQKFEDQIEHTYGKYFIKTGAKSADVKAVTNLTNTSRKLDKFKTGKGLRFRNVLTWTASALAIFSVLGDGVAMAEAIATNPPEVQGEWNNFMQSYNSILENGIKGYSPTKADGLNLVRMYDNYLAAIKTPEKIRSTIVTAMTAWCEFNLL